MKSNFFNRLFLLVIFAAGLEASLSGQKVDSVFLDQVDQLVEEWDRNSPGGAVGIMSEGELVYERYVGLANLETKEAFSENTLSDIGSISKQFTACLIAILEEEGKLSIEDGIREYLPEFPPYADPIKVKHLIFHTSGIKDYEALESLQGKHYFGEHMTNEYVLTLISRQKTLNFPPGSTYEYSNSNYILLAQIVARVSGKTLNEFAKEKIFEPLGMDNTFFHINQGEDFSHRAIGYQSSSEGYSRPIYESHLVGDGGIFTTLSDLAKWDQNFYHNRLGKGNPSLIKRMGYRDTLKSGILSNVAFAQFYTSHPFGENSWSHGGSGGGYRSFYIRFEEARFSVIVLSTTDQKNAFSLANEITQLFFQYKPSKPEPLANEVGEKEATDFIPDNQLMIARLNGYYYDETEIGVLNIRFDPQKKHFIVDWTTNQDGGYVALPISPNILAEQADLSFTYRLDEATNRLHHSEGDKLIRSWQKLAPPTFPASHFKGSYYSEEIDHQILVEVKEGKLTSDTLLSASNSGFSE
ncbi:MAG: serine hydrolase domain-containing protein, partial [Bacteroidota bacterium]